MTFQQNLNIFIGIGISAETFKTWSTKIFTINIFYNTQAPSIGLNNQQLNRITLDIFSSH